MNRRDEHGQRLDFTRYDLVHESSDEDQLGSVLAQIGQVGLSGSVDSYDEDSSDLSEEVIENSRRGKLDERDIRLLYKIVDIVDSSRPASTANNDLALLLQTFKHYSTDKGITKANYPHFDVISTALIKLYRFPGLSWKQKLLSYVSQFSEERQRKEPGDHLEAGIAEFEFRQRRRYFELLCARYAQRLQHFRNMTSIARIRDEYSLCREALRHWYNSMESLEAERWSVGRSYNIDLLRKYLRHMQSTYERRRENHENARLLTKSTFFGLWKKRYDCVMNQGITAESRYTKKLISTCFRGWVYTTLESSEDRRYLICLMADMFDTWLVRYGTEKRREFRAIRYDQYNICQMILFKWKSKKESLSVKLRVAEGIDSKNLLQTFTGYWAKANILAKSKRVILDKYGGEVTRTIFEDWRTRTRQILEAKRFAKFMLLLKVFQHWSLVARCQTVIRYSNIHLAQSIFHKWLISERLKVFKRYSSALTMARIFEQWKNKHIKVTNGLSRTSQFAIRRLNTLRKKSCFQLWRYRLRNLCRMDDAAMSLRERLLLQTSLNKMVDAAYSLEILNRKAGLMDQQRLFSLTFLQWRLRVLYRQQLRLSVLLKEFNNHRNIEFKAAALQIWVNKAQTQLDLKDRADTMIKLKDRELAQRALVNWREQADVLTNNTEHADLIYVTYLYSTLFDKWKQRKKEVDTLDQEARFISEVNDLDMMEKILRQWRMKLFKVKSRRRVADELHSRIRSERFRKMWKLWRAKTVDMQLSGRRSTRVVAASANILRHDRLSSTQNSLLETPTRVRSRKNVPLTSVDRWRKMRAIPGKAASPVRPPNLSFATPARSSLRNEIMIDNDDFQSITS